MNFYFEVINGLESISDVYIWDEWQEYSIGAWIAESMCPVNPNFLRSCVIYDQSHIWSNAFSVSIYSIKEGI